MARPVRHKFRAKPTVYDGRRYASQAEAAYAKELEFRREAKEVLFWLEQVPLALPGNTKYVVDFLEFHADGTVRFVDVKGMETPMFKMKKKQVESIYPIDIEVVKCRKAKK